MRTFGAKLIRAAACTALTLTAAVAANADTYDFALTGAYTAHWQLPSSPVGTASSNGVNIRFLDYAGGTFPGSTRNIVNLYFYNATLGGGVSITDTQPEVGYQEVLSTSGPQLYSGSESTPTFLLGTFALMNANGTGETYTLTITNVSAVPEPESYAMLLAGLSALGFVAARRRKV